MRLHTYFRSAAAHRVRIALHLKGLPFEPAPVHLRRGEQRSGAFLALNPQGFVPVLEDGPAAIPQSLAILEYLEEVHPEPPLLPSDPLGRARVRSLALVCAADTHPLGNLRVLRHLEATLGLDPAAREAWCRHWIAEGLAALERRLASEPGTGRLCHGDAPTLADLCLVPQVAGARRWGADLGPFPTVRRIDAACTEFEAFRAAAPASQPDAEP